MIQIQNCHLHVFAAVFTFVARFQLTVSTRVYHTAKDRLGMTDVQRNVDVMTLITTFTHVTTGKSGGPFLKKKNESTVSYST